MLFQNLGLNFVAKQLQEKVKESTLESLGVSKMSISQLVEIAKAFLRKGEVEQSEEESEKEKDAEKEGVTDAEKEKNGEKAAKGERENDFIWIGEWFSLIFSTLQETCDFTQETLDLIRSLKIFVLCDGSFVSLKEQTIFFPIDSGGSSKKLSKPIVYFSYLS